MAYAHGGMAKPFGADVVRCGMHPHGLLLRCLVTCLWMVSYGSIVGCLNTLQACVERQILTNGIA